MNGLKHFLTIVLLLLVASSAAFANFEFQNIHVISFTPADKSDQHTLVFDAETTDYGDLTNLPKKKRRFTVKLRCEARFCTIEEYRAAIQLLQQRIERGPDITIARMSATGWRPVRGRRGVFESVGLRIPKPPDDYKGTPILLFLHDDRF
ncbi:MAG: hypothetical protein RL088_3863 [Verrucomicrobiota bacterium]|jgi:hypothetical protein